LRDFYGAAEIGKSDQTAGAGIRINKFRGRIPGLGLIAEVHGGVVKEQDHVARLRIGGASILFKRKTGDRLFLAIFPNLEIFLGEIPNVVVFFVGHHGIHENETSFGAEDGRVVGCGRDGGSRGRSSRCWLLGVGYWAVGAQFEEHQATG